MLGTCVCHLPPGVSLCLHIGELQGANAPLDLSLSLDVYIWKVKDLQRGNGI